MSDQDLPISGKDVTLQLLLHGVPQRVIDTVVTFSVTARYDTIDTKPLGTNDVLIDKQPIGWEGELVLIQELGPPFRLMTFAGADMPERPLGVAGNHRGVQTWYPGQSKACTQVMGTSEEPIVLRGWFRNALTMLDGGATVRVATLHGIMQGQGLCQLIWGDAVVRKGRVARCDFKFHRTQVVRYEITFEVDQADEVVAVVPLPIVAALETGADVIRGAHAIDAVV